MTQKAFRKLTREQQAHILYYNPPEDVDIEQYGKLKSIYDQDSASDLI